MRAAPFVLMIVATACAQEPPRPAPLDTRNDHCSWCRMTVSDGRLAAQVVAPLEEPRFFDDIGCLRAYLRSNEKLPERAVAYVADHRTGEWVPASRAVYARVPSIDTPMGSHVVAHADSSSRELDAGARGGAPLTAEDVFGTGVLP